MRNFSEVLKGLRNERMLSQRELASKLGISNSAVAMYESGNREPNYDALENIADFFNVDMNYLLGKTPIRNSYRDGDTLIEKNNNQIYFENAQQAFEFILSQPSVSAYGGYDLDKMSDEEIIEFAEDIQKMLKIIATKYTNK